MIDPGEEILRLRGELLAYEQRGAIGDISEIASRMEEREEMQGRLAAIEREVRLLRQWLGRLPALPDLACIRWAECVLAYPNGRILTVDTIFPARDARFVHVLLLDFDGGVRFSAYVATGCTLSGQEMRSLGITTQNLREALPLPQVWPSLLERLKGRFVVSYGLERTRQALESGAEQYGLEPPVIVGECLLLQCLRYFRISGFVGLTSLCEHIGLPLPEPPDCTAIDRAWGQLHLLRAMAQGINGVHRGASAHWGSANERADDL